MPMHRFAFLAFLVVGLVVLGLSPWPDDGATGPGLSDAADDPCPGLLSLDADLPPAFLPPAAAPQRCPPAPRPVGGGPPRARAASPPRAPPSP
jgi:hypothetical protein